MGARKQKQNLRSFRDDQHLATSSSACIATFALRRPPRIRSINTRLIFTSLRRSRTWLAKWCRSGFCYRHTAHAMCSRTRKNAMFRVHGHYASQHISSSGSNFCNAICLTFKVTAVSAALLEVPNTLLAPPGSRIRLWNDRRTRIAALAAFPNAGATTLESRRRARLRRVNCSVRP